MIYKELSNRVDLKKLTEDDFILSGEFRLIDEIYKGWDKRPEFRQEGTDTYRVFDNLFNDAKFDECYELIIQTTDISAVVSSGYLYQSQEGDINFGTRSGYKGEQNIYYNSTPVWFSLLTDDHKPIVEGPVDLIFVNVSPYHNKRETERQRVLA
ncbi:MAG: hypothetical protein KAS11_00040 [Candidatus Aenigmarchaeota archaeon]|nr:hypothetical protein [Candidatus Aenigmarchaeota archaeon]